LGATNGFSTLIFSLGASSGSTGPYLLEASIPGKIGAVIKRVPSSGDLMGASLYLEPPGRPGNTGPLNVNMDEVSAFLISGVYLH